MKAAIFAFVAICSLGLTLGLPCGAIYKKWAAAHFHESRKDDFNGVIGADALSVVFDENGDGVISKDEFNDRLDEIDIEVSSAVKEAAVAVWDADGDGAVTVAEVAAFFGAVDANGDGAVTEEEAVNTWANFFKTVFDAAGETPEDCQ